MSDKRTESQFGNDRSNQVIFRKGDKAGKKELSRRANQAGLAAGSDPELSRQTYYSLASARDIVSGDRKSLPINKIVTSETPVSGDDLAQAVREKQHSESNYNKQVVQGRIDRTKARRRG